MACLGPDNRNHPPLPQSGKAPFSGERFSDEGRFNLDEKDPNGPQKAGAAWMLLIAKVMKTNGVGCFPVTTSVEFGVV